MLDQIDGLNYAFNLSNYKGHLYLVIASYLFPIVTVSVRIKDLYPAFIQINEIIALIQISGNYSIKYVIVNVERLIPIIPSIS